MVVLPHHDEPNLCLWPTAQEAALARCALADDGSSSFGGDIEILHSCILQGHDHSKCLIGFRKQCLRSTWRSDGNSYPFPSQVSSPKVGILKRGPALVILRRQEVGFAQFIVEGCAND